LPLLLVLSGSPLTGRAVDAGAIDGGPLEETDGGGSTLARWQGLADGGTLYDGGFTDLVELSVNASVELVFPRQVVLTVCDSPLVEVATQKDSLRLVGAEPGVTQCGFWFDRSAVPSRYVRVSVEP
jgi:hypothetical protein